MRSFLLIVSLLVSSSRLHNVQGARLGESSASKEHGQKVRGESTDAVQRVSAFNIAAAVPEEAHSSSTGMIRKILTRKFSASITVSTSSKKLEGNTIMSKEASGKDHFRVKTSPVSHEVLDMTDMDYSPAKKRSSIHN